MAAEASAPVLDGMAYCSNDEKGGAVQHARCSAEMASSEYGAMHAVLAAMGAESTCGDSVTAECVCSLESCIIGLFAASVGR